MAFPHHRALSRRTFLSILALSLAALKCSAVQAADRMKEKFFLSDFGGLMRRKVKGHITTLAEAQHAMKRGEIVHPRGTGHSCMGQGLKEDAWVFIPPDHKMTFSKEDETVYASAATTIYDIDIFLQKHGYMLPVSPDHRVLSLGGVLSVGGYCAESVRRGWLTQHVMSLDILTHDGIIHQGVEASSARAQKVLRGLGRNGIILSARMKCVKLQRDFYIRHRFFTSYSSYCQAFVDIEIDPALDMIHGVWAMRMQGLSSRGMLVTGTSASSPHLPAQKEKYFYEKDLREARKKETDKWVYGNNAAYYVWSDHMVTRENFFKQMQDTLATAVILKEIGGDVVIYSSLIGPPEQGLEFSVGLYSNFSSEQEEAARKAADIHLLHSERAQQQRSASPYKYGWYHSSEATI